MTVSSPYSSNQIRWHVMCWRSYKLVNPSLIEPEIMTSYFCNDIIAQLNQRCNGCFWCYPAILYFTHQTYANTKMHERVSHPFRTDQELELELSDRRRRIRMDKLMKIAIRLFKITGRCHNVQRQNRAVVCRLLSISILLWIDNNWYATFK